MNTVYQGDIAIGGTTRIECKSSSLSISSIIIANATNAYTITATIYTGYSDTKETPLYQFSLDLGDSVRDSNVYILTNGGYLILDTDATGGTYYIEGFVS